MKTHLLFAIVLLVGVASAFNVTEELQKDPNYSEFNDILSKSGIADDINKRNSITVCAIPNSQIDQLRASLGPLATDKQLADVARAQVLLTFVDPAGIKKTGTGNQQVTTLYQATGSAPGDAGVGNITSDNSGNTNIVMTGSNATITKSVTQIGYNLSIVEIDRPLTPKGVLALAPSPAPPPGLVPVPAPVPVAVPVPVPVPGPAVLVPVPTGSAPVGSADTSDQNKSGARILSVSVSGLSLVLLGFFW